MTTTTHTERSVYSAWIAEIKGLDPKYGLARAFVPKRDVSEHRTSKKRDYDWTLSLEDGAIYEYSVQHSTSRTDRGFWTVREGALHDIERAEVVKLVTGQSQ